MSILDPKTGMTMTSYVRIIGFCGRMKMMLMEIGERLGDGSKIIVNTPKKTIDEM